MGKILNSTVLIQIHKEGKVVASGSGVIISEDGNILTNYHVVHKADQIRIWTHENKNRQYHVAKVLGTDPVADLALLDIDPVGKEVFYNAGLDLRAGVVYPGIDVWAVGAPLQLPWTVTKGIINQVNRLSFITPYVHLIQHDAVIQEGSSGGPLFNADGNVIGINTYVIAPTSGKIEKSRQYSGMGYAVQMNSIAYSLAQMHATGKVVRPALKLNIINLTEPLRDWILESEDPAPYIPNTFGMIMNFIEPDGHAAKQGMQNWDVVVAIDGQPVNDMTDVAGIMIQKIPGETVNVLIIRRGEFINIPYLLDAIDIPLRYYDDKKIATDPFPTPPPDEDVHPEEEEKKNPKPSMAPEDD